jgi:hypothetical protein
MIVATTDKNLVNLTRKKVDLAKQKIIIRLKACNKNAT